MGTHKLILVVEDDPGITEVLERGLGEEGYATRSAQDGETGLRLLEQLRPDLLILDINLPGIDGLEVCRKVRSGKGYTPIIIVSGKTAESQRILGLELGADDYVTKPFSVLEVAARARALFRRIDAMAQVPANPGAAINHGRFFLDPLAREAKLGGGALSLTAREFDLLHFFMRHPGQVFSRLELLNQVWGYGHDGYEHTVNSHINRLRGKVEANPAHPAHILTVWGVGYKFSPEVEAPA